MSGLTLNKYQVFLKSVIRKWHSEYLCSSSATSARVIYNSLIGKLNLTLLLNLIIKSQSNSHSLEMHSLSWESQKDFTSKLHFNMETECLRKANYLGINSISYTWADPPDSSVHGPKKTTWSSAKAAGSYCCFPAQHLPPSPRELVCFVFDYNELDFASLLKCVWGKSNFMWVW